MSDLDEDGLALITALAARGIEGVPAVWDAPDVDWERFDLVVVRSTWDYAERRGEFLLWAESVPRVLNPPRVLRWSTDKRRYLTDLERAGVAVVPTRFVAPGERFDPPAEPFVVKPAVSAGGRSSARFERKDPRAEALVRRIHAEARTAMVQAYLGDVEETALVYLGGRFSHAVRRRVPLPVAASRPGLYLEEELGPAEASAAERAVAERALAAAPGELLYARVDLVDGAVLELELAEPSLYLEFGDGAAERFAAAIAAALSQSPDQRGERPDDAPVAAEGAARGLVDSGDPRLRRQERPTGGRLRPQVEDDLDGARSGLVERPGPAARAPGRPGRARDERRRRPLEHAEAHGLATTAGT